MAIAKKELAAGTGGSIVVKRCQTCDGERLETVLFLGYLPPVNTMPTIGTRPAEQPAYPAELLRCLDCTLAQLGTIVDPQILFPPSYPYTSGTTRILRENFAQLAAEVGELYPLKSGDLTIDIGSNDGTLLANFVGPDRRVLGIEPTDTGKLAVTRGIPTLTSFFNRAAVDSVLGEYGKANLVTAANVFAHIEDVHSVVDGIVSLLDDRGIFISESHYFRALIETVQYDTIYHEHLRYYSLTSLSYLLGMHGLEVIRAKRIPTHGGSIRVYASRKGKFKPDESVQRILAEEKEALSPEVFKNFRSRVVNAKLGLLALLNGIKKEGGRVYGVGAPSRASTLVSYTGLTEDIIVCVGEIKGSYKIGKYMPGSLIPVVEESKLFEDQPEYALLLSWHIADELAPKLRKRGFRGKLIVPLPEARILSA